MVRIQQRIAFDHVHLGTVIVARAIEPRVAGEVDRIDHERVSLPAAS